MNSTAMAPSGATLHPQPSRHVIHIALLCLTVLIAVTLYYGLDVDEGTSAVFGKKLLLAGGVLAQGARTGHQVWQTKRRRRSGAHSATRRR